MNPPVHATRVILRKRNGETHPAGEIESLIAGMLDGTVADYQMTAWMMAVFFKGMTADETTRLTRAMLGSGDVLPAWGPGAGVVDKHSTGGIGDKISLIAAPAAAACGLRVPMISGRGLGHTGGTLDKLEAVPGYQVNLSTGDFVRIVETVGCSIAGASTTLVPADKRMYALRDVAGIVESVPLIVSSIVSKKAAARLEGLVLDVKVGSGGFSLDATSAAVLGRRLVETGELLGIRCEALLTWMDGPLGVAVGNGVETAEAMRMLRGDPVADDLREVTLAVTAAMLRMVEPALSDPEARDRVARALRSGEAMERFARMVHAHGGDVTVLERPDALCAADVLHEVRSREDGYVRDIHARTVGEIIVDLGGGRRRKDDPVDPNVGVSFLARRGDAVRRGEPLAILHARTRDDALHAATRLLDAYAFDSVRPDPVSPVLSRIKVEDPAQS